MGFQTFSCVICGESCTRRNSKQYKEGRACSSHQEVQDDQNAKQEALLKQEILNVFLRYKKTVGIKNPNKTKLKEWLKTYTLELRSNIKESASADKALSLYKSTGMLSLSYDVSDKFVNTLYDLIKVRQDDPDWIDAAALKKEYKAKKREFEKDNRPESEKAKHNADVQDKSDDAPGYKFKERRGAKEVPRRRPSSLKVS